MKLTYRDKIIAAVLIAIVLMAIGIFVLVKPQGEKIKSNKQVLAAKEVEKQQIEDKIAQIDPLKKQILETHDKTVKLTEVFVPVENVNDTRYLDQYMQKFADESHVTLKRVELQDSSLEPLAYYYGDTTDTFKELRESADVDGSLQKDYDSSIIESTVLGQRTRESVIQTKYGVSINGTRANIWKYLEALKEFEKAANIRSVTINDYSFGKDAAEQANVTLPDSEDGDGAEVQASGGTVITDTSDVDIIITLYSVVNMPKPDVDTVPAVAASTAE